VATADFELSINTVHDADEPEHAPVHPANALPEKGVAVNVTDVPKLNKA